MSSALLLNALLGGAVLGLCAGLKTLLTGSVLGVSGAVKGSARGDVRSLTFLAGMVGGAFLGRLVAPSAMVAYEGLSVPALVGAGLLGGVGTFKGNGCTSGMGITGMARLSRRGLVATMTFFMTGLLTASLSDSRRFVVTSAGYQPVPAAVAWSLAAGAAALFALVYVANRVVRGSSGSPSGEATAALFATELVAGLGFSSGLVISGMNRASIVLDFLDVRSETWSFALCLVLIGAVSVKAVLYHGLSKRRHTAVFGPKMASLPCKAKKEDHDLIYGAMLFGISWGLSGICPGPGIVMLAFTDPVPGLAYVLPFCLAHLLAHQVDKHHAAIDAVLGRISDLHAPKADSDSDRPAVHCRSVARATSLGSADGTMPLTST
jgi:uncharacterized membrane protein YedE/YeeE